ncbi:hypothetical protein EV126DRAFT_170992 [Verticillium dahliae]|nr:hypothetical protein EV126DRAFT_170992 [Verticillium dahliae]
MFVSHHRLFKWQGFHYLQLYKFIPRRRGLSMSSINDEGAGVEHTLEDVLRVIPKSVIDSLSPASGCQWTLSKEGPNKYRISFRAWQVNSWVEVASHDVSTVISIAEIYDKFPVHRARTLDAAQMQQTLPHMQHLAYQQAAPAQDTYDQPNDVDQNEESSDIAASSSDCATQISHSDEGQVFAPSRPNTRQYHGIDCQVLQSSGQPAYSPSNALNTITNVRDENNFLFHSQAAIAANHMLDSPTQNHASESFPQNMDSNDGGHLHRGFDPSPNMALENNLEETIFPVGTWNESMNPSLTDQSEVILGSGQAPNVAFGHETAFQDLGFMQDYMIEENLLSPHQGQPNQFSNHILSNSSQANTGIPSLLEDNTFFFINNHGLAMSVEDHSLLQGTTVSNAMEYTAGVSSQQEIQEQSRKER